MKKIILLALVGLAIILIGFRVNAWDDRCIRTDCDIPAVVTLTSVD